MPENDKIKIFISYSHKDKEYCLELDNHLSALKRNNIVESWQDSAIVPGEYWDTEIKRRLNESDIVIFLLSSDFLASSYIYDHEIQTTYERHVKGGVIIVPVMIRKCHIKGTLFEHIQGLPIGLDPILSKKWDSPDDAYFNVVEGLERIIIELKRKKDNVLHYIFGERNAPDEVVNMELEKADKFYEKGNYGAAFPIYLLYQNHNMFTSTHQSRIGFCYQNGYGVEIDYDKALEWYNLSAKQGNPDGQCNLGFMYRIGIGVKQDYNEAVKLYLQSAKQDNAQGQKDLGFMYEMGYGVDRDYVEAVKWYYKSASLGNPYGQNNLGWMYNNGYGVEKDYYEAVKWYQKSAEQGNASGLCNLGWMYENGYGIIRDINKASELYQNAAKQGSPAARKACKRLHITY